MIRTTVSIHGTDKVLGAINALSGRVVGETADAIRVTGNEIAQEARATAPKKTGKYRRTIRSRFDQRAMVARIAPWVGRRPHPLGHLLEFGHRGPNGKGWVSGRPHLFPALDQAVGRLRQRMDKVVKP